MRGKRGGQGSISGKVNCRLCQSVPKQGAGYHLPTCRQNPPEQEVNMYFSKKHPYGLPKYTIVGYHQWNGHKDQGFP